MTTFLAEVDAIEVLGVFFLSVEAIKLENLYKLRDRFLLPLRHGLQPGTFQPNKTVFTFAELRSDHLALRHFFLSHYGTGCGLMAILLLLACSLSQSLSALVFTFVSKPLNVILIALILLSPIVLPLIGTMKESNIHPNVTMFVMALTLFPFGFIPFFLGEAAHQGSKVAIRAVLRGLELIAQETPTGTIGILGFLAVLIGKGIQLLAGTVQH